MIFYAEKLILCQFYDFQEKNLYFMIFYDFMPAGTPVSTMPLVM